MARRLELFVAPDEPTVVLQVGRRWVSVWFGSLRDWDFGFRCHARSQNPHHKFYLGPLCFGCFTND